MKYFISFELLTLYPRFMSKMFSLTWKLYKNLRRSGKVTWNLALLNRHLSYKKSSIMRFCLIYFRWFSNIEHKFESKSVVSDRMFLIAQSLDYQDQYERICFYFFLGPNNFLKSCSCSVFWMNIEHHLSCCDHLIWTFYGLPLKKYYYQ